MTPLLDKLRRYAADTLICWAIRIYPKRTEADHAVMRALVGVLKTALAGAGA